MKSRKIIAGVDEVGRGSLVGSVFSAAVILSESSSNLKLMDSKKLSEKKRIDKAQEIIFNCLSVSIGIASRDEIDTYNIHHATLLSMKRAIENLTIQPDLVLIDGVYTPHINIECESIVRGDTKIKQISAASIVAKVSRDFEMDYLHNKFQMYNFKNNNGYGTKEHMDAISCFGKTIYHRNSFVK